MVVRDCNGELFFEKVYKDIIVNVLYYLFLEAVWVIWRV